MKINRRVRAIGALFAVASLATACGGGAPQANDAAAVDDDDTTEANVQEELVCDGEKMIHQLSFIPNPQHVGILYAYEKGYFDEVGLDFDLKEGGPTLSAALQIAEGNADTTNLSLGDGLNAVSSGADVRMIAGIAQQTPLRFLSWPDNPTAEPADFEGKSVSVQQAGNPSPPVRLMAKNAGVPLDSIEVVQTSVDVSSLLDNKVDVFTARTYAHIAMLEEQDVSYPDDLVVLNPADFDADLPEDSYWVNGNYLDENPDAVACFLQAAQRGWTDAAENLDEAKEIVAKHAPASTWNTEAIDIDVDETITHATETSSGETVAPLTTDIDYLNQGVESLIEVDEVSPDIELSDVLDLEPLERALEGQ